MAKKNVTITLTVDVDQLFKGGSVDSSCTLSDDNGGSSSTGKPEGFVSEVYASKKVTWQPDAEGKDSNDYDLMITEIDYENGTNIFGSNPIYGDKSGKVKASVLNSAKTDASETYTIQFTVKDKSSGSINSYSIDPELQVDQPGSN